MPQGARQPQIAPSPYALWRISYEVILSPLQKNGHGPAKARRIGKAHLQSRRATGKTKAGHILSAQELGIRSRGRMEPAAQSAGNRFCQQEVPSHAGRVRGGKSYAARAGAFSRTQGYRSGVDQKSRQGKSGCAGAEYTGKFGRKSDSAADQ